MLEHHHPLINQALGTSRESMSYHFPIATNGCVAVTVELRGQSGVGYAQAEADADANIAKLAGNEAFRTGNLLTA